MNAKKEKSEVPKVEEPITSYKISVSKTEVEGVTGFDFDAEFKKGLTPEQFKAEMAKRIKTYPWEK